MDFNEPHSGVLKGVHHRLSNAQLGASCITLHVCQRLPFDPRALGKLLLLPSEQRPGSGDQSTVNHTLI